MRNDQTFDLQNDERQRRISERAFARFEARGGEHGHDMEDWLAAEREEAEAGAPAEALASIPPPGLAPSVHSGDRQRDEDSRRKAEQAARAINRDAQRQLVR